MKKCIVLPLIAALALTGCSTMKSTTGTGLTVAGLLAGVVALAALSGDSDGYSKPYYFDDYVRENGAPNAHYTASNGDTIYSFIRPCSHSRRFEETIVTVNTNNRIENISNPQTCS